MNNPSISLAVHLDTDDVELGTKINDVWDDGRVFALYIGTTYSGFNALKDFFTAYVTKEQLLQLQASLQADIHELLGDAVTA